MKECRKPSTHPLGFVDSGKVAQCICLENDSAAGLRKLLGWSTIGMDLGHRGTRSAPQFYFQSSVAQVVLSGIKICSIGHLSGPFSGKILFWCGKAIWNVVALKPTGNRLHFRISFHNGGCMNDKAGSLEGMDSDRVERKLCKTTIGSSS